MSASLIFGNRHDYTADFFCRRCGLEQTDDWYANIPPCPRVAEEALAKADATNECRYANGTRWDRECSFAQAAPCSSEVVDEEGPSLDVQQIHGWHSSLLLDGFSIEELTAVGA